MPAGHPLVAIVNMSLKITITGYPGEGKTTLASEIAALLQSLKMDVAIKDMDLDPPYGGRSDELHQGCLLAMNGREVLIETVQLRNLNKMTLYYVKQFNLYYAGTDKDGVLRFCNARRDAICFEQKHFAEAKCKELGEDISEIEEKIF